MKQSSVDSLQLVIFQFHIIQEVFMQNKLTPIIQATTLYSRFVEKILLCIPYRLVFL